MTPLLFKFSTWLTGFSNLIFWASGAVLLESQGGTVTEDQILITLPVFIASLLGTASGTFWATRYLTTRERRIERLELKLERLLHQQGVPPDSR